MARAPQQLCGLDVAARLRDAVPGSVLDANDEWVTVAPAKATAAFQWLHDDAAFDAAQLSSLCGVDRYTHFEVVYHLQSLDRNHQIVVKVPAADRDRPEVPTAYPIWRGALLQEREAYDLLGIGFSGHPDLRRVFLWDGYPGHPLRKDFLQMPGHHPGLPRFPFEESGKQAR